MASTRWKTYEEVARYLLTKFRKHFKLDHVEQNATIAGTISGTTWNIEGKAIHENGEDFFIVECRRYTTSKLKQEHLAALAFRVYDSGAKGGIVVSPLAGC